MQHFTTFLELKIAALAGEPVQLHMTDDLSHGDLTTNIAFKIADRLGDKPLTIAENFAKVLMEDDEVCRFVAIRAVLPGFLNVYILPETIITHVEQLAALEPGMLLSDPWLNDVVVIEYSQPNIAKPMHFGHLRTTVIGETLKRIFSALGATAIGVNHLGDWGSQFGKLLVAYAKWGSPERLETGGIRELLSLYIRFHEEAERHPELMLEGAQAFARLEKGEQKSHELWRQFRDVSMVEFRKFYARLDISMDEPEMGESDYVGALPALIQNAQTTGVAHESDGAIVIDIGEDLPPCLIQKSDGATIYATRDLAAIDYRIKRWHPKTLIYVVAADQSLHFQQVFRAARRLQLAQTTELVHVPYGLVSLPEGKMSTRAGRVIFLEDVLDEAVKRADHLLAQKSPDLPAASRELTAEAIGVGAVKYQVLNQHRNSTIVFHWETMLALQGNTGPYLQYTLARARSLVDKVALSRYDFERLAEADPTEMAVVRLCLRLPWVLKRAARDYAPNHLTDWLHQLASQFNAFYETHPVLQADNDAARERRVAITHLVSQMLKYGLALLAIKTPDRL